MEPILFFAVAAIAVVALSVLNARRRSAWARETFMPLAATVNGRVTAPRLGTPSLRFQAARGEAKLRETRQKVGDVTGRHLALRLPAATAEGEVTRIRTKPTQVVYTKGEVLTGGTGLPDRWHVQSTHPERVRALLDAGLRALLLGLEDRRRVSIEIRNERVTIRWGHPVDAASARALLELGRRIDEILDRRPSPVS